MTPQTLINTDLAVSMLINSVLGFLMGGGMFLFVYIVSRKGLGGGDVKFMAATGLFVTINKILGVMLYGSILAALTGGLLGR